MQKLVFVVLFLLSSKVFASTIFHWQADKSKPEKGNCYQLDEETYGKKFRAKVKIEKCKPEKTAYLFLYRTGKCYEVDDQTGGQNYIKKTKIKYCRPAKTVTQMANINNKVECYELDEKTKGSEFYKKVKRSECASDLNAKGETTYFWEFREPGYGTCYKELYLNGKPIKSKVKNTDCRPEKYIYRFIRRNETSGICVEQDPNNERAFSLKTKIKNCKPADTIFVFYTPKNKKYGQCFEIDSETKGDLYIDKAKNKDCTPD